MQFTAVCKWGSLTWANEPTRHHNGIPQSRYLQINIPRVPEVLCKADGGKSKYHIKTQTKHYIQQEGLKILGTCN
jgi:hypothetical protein